MCNKTYRVQSNAVSCANPKCSLIMCMLCFVRDFLRNLVKSNQYRFILTIPCCACQVDESFHICAWPPTTKCANFYSVMKEDAATHLSGIPTELLKISGQFFRARLALNRIINTSCEAPFSKADRQSAFILAFITSGVRNASCAIKPTGSSPMPFLVQTQNVR